MSKGYKTAKELEVELRSFHDKIDRETFYNVCMNELDSIDERYEKRCAVMMKRKAVFTMLSELELIKINRGVRKNV